MNLFGQLDSHKRLSRTRKKPLGKVELIAIALGGMIGGGIFSILGISVEIVGWGTPIAILLGGLLAYAAAYSYSKLAVYYKDEGATYSFFKKTFPKYKYSISIVGWLIVFGYISTLALYAFTFASYFSSLFGFDKPWQINMVALLVLIVFSTINWLSVNGMGKVEDVLVYTKVALLLVISGLFLKNGQSSEGLNLLHFEFPIQNLVIVAAITFVAYEGFQLVIHAYDEAEEPNINVPSAIRWAVLSSTFIYVLLALGALKTIPQELLIRDKEYALAAGASDILGSIGYSIVIAGALLATSSAINGTLFGASRLMAVIAQDGVFPKFLALRSEKHIPRRAIAVMTVFAFVFILTGGLQMIIEFGSITFILVSLLMAYTNHTIRDKTQSNQVATWVAMILLGVAAFLILYFEFTHNIKQVVYISIVYLILMVMAWVRSIHYGSK